MATWNQGCPWKKKLTHMRGTTNVLTELKAALLALDDSHPMTDPSLAVHACTSYVSIPATYNNIQGSLKLVSAAKQTLSAAGSAIPATKYGAYAFQVGSNGTIDTIAAAANGTGYATAPLAIAGLSAAPADHARLGTLTVYAGLSTAFTPGTTALSGASAVASFTDASTLFEVITASLATDVPQTDI